MKRKIKRKKHRAEKRASGRAAKAERERRSAGGARARKAGLAGGLPTRSLKRASGKPAGRHASPPKKPAAAAGGKTPVAGAPERGPAARGGESGRKMEVEFVARLPTGEKGRIRSKLESLDEVLVLETNIDRLYSHVCRQGEARVRDVAKRFGVEVALVEEWGRILEDHGLAQLHYPPFGELVIRAKGWAEEKRAKKKNEKDKRRGRK